MPDNPWELFQRRDRKREPLLLILTPLTPTRDEAIKTVRDILRDEFGGCVDETAVKIIDALTRKRD